MSLILSGSDGLSDVDGTAATPAIRGTDANTGIFFPAADTIAFTEGGVEAARFDSSGRFGIGTASPTTKLNVSSAGADVEIRASTTTSGNVRFGFDADGAYYNWIQTNRSSGAIQFAISNSEVMRLDASGNLGIGTTTPAGKLDITSGTARMYFSNQSATAFFTAVNTANSAYAPMAINGSELILKTGDAERMRIDSSGHFMVATTSTNPVASRVNGAVITPTGALEVRSPSASSYFGLSVTSGVHISFYTDNGSAFVGAGNINSNGASTLYSATSDYRLKDNIQPLNNALSRVAQLNPVKWTWKEGYGGTQPECEGFIAHELAEILPIAVVGEKDGIDDDGKPVYQGVDTSFLVATLTAAIQEQQALIQSLTARITALETPAVTPTTGTQA